MEVSTHPRGLGDGMRWSWWVSVGGVSVAWGRERRGRDAVRAAETFVRARLYDTLSALGGRGPS